MHGIKIRISSTALLDQLPPKSMQDGVLEDLVLEVLEDLAFKCVSCNAQSSEIGGHSKQSKKHR